MSDGQDKSDDLIAELAKLMAQGASGGDAGKPAPRLVTSGDADPAAAASIRLPGMVPPPVRPEPAEEDREPVVSAAPADMAPATAPATPFTLRLPGDAADDTAEELAPRSGSLPETPAEILPVPEIAPPATSRPAPPPFDFGPVPVPEAPAEPPLMSAPPAAPLEPIPAAPEVNVRPAPVASADEAPAIDFDFDFGFGARPRPGSAAPASAPAIGSEDPIAALISANLDRDPPRPNPERPAPFSTPAFPLRPEAPREDRTETGRFSFIPQRAAPAAPAASTPQQMTPPPFAADPFAQPASSAPDVDPLEEIRGLVGKSLNQEPRPADVPPAVPPLTTGFAPRRAAISDTEPAIPSAEAAILAASAASGSEPPRFDLGEPSFSRPKARPEKGGGLRPYVGLAVAGTLLVASGFGLYWVLGLNRPATTEVPVLSADSEPVKEAAPAEKTGESADQSVVFNQMDGTAPATSEQLVSRDQSDAAMADAAASDTAASDSELANRKVRTVTVRPDGTIVSGDEAVAGNAELPVDRPNVPDLPGPDVQPSDLLAATTGADVTATVPQTAAPAPVAAPSALPEPSDPANVVPGKVAPLPLARLDRTTLAARQPVTAPVAAPEADLAVAPAGTDGPIDLTGGTAPAEPVAEPAAPAPLAAAPVATGGSGPYVQLSSQPTPADAQASLATMQRRLGGLLGGRALEVRQVDLKQKGVWYRIVLPTSTFQEATQVCATLKANGADCVPNNGT